MVRGTFIFIRMANGFIRYKKKDRRSFSSISMRAMAVWSNDKPFRLYRPSSKVVISVPRSWYLQTADSCTRGIDCMTALPSSKFATMGVWSIGERFGRKATIRGVSRSIRQGIGLFAAINAATTWRYSESIARREVWRSAVSLLRSATPPWSDSQASDSRVSLCLTNPFLILFPLAPLRARRSQNAGVQGER